MKIICQTVTFYHVGVMPSIKIYYFTSRVLNINGNFVVFDRDRGWMRNLNGNRFENRP